MNKKLAINISLILVGLFYFSCQKEKPYDRIVSTVGNEKLKFSEFMFSYTLSPHFRPNSTLREARLQHLEYLQDRTLMTMAAEKENLDTIPEIQNRIRYITEKEILKYLYDKEILSGIEVTDEEAWQEYKRSNIQVHLRHIFAPNKKKADEYYQRLQNGETFEQIAREAFSNQKLAENGGDLGFVTISDLDPLLVDSVYNQRLHQVSKPLQSSYGYHIVKVEDIKQNLFLTDEDFRTKKEEMVNSVKMRRAQRESGEYLAKVLKGKSVTIKTEVLNELMGLSKNYIRVKDQNAELPFLMPKVTDDEIEKVIESSGSLLDKTLVIFNNGSWTVKEFLMRIIYTPPVNRPAFDKKQVIAKRIVDMVRDELLLQEAYRKGYDKTETVKESIAMFRNELLADEFQKRIQRVGYNKQNEEVWSRRRALYQRLKAEIPIRINRDVLFQDLNAEELQKRQDPIHIVLRDQYKW